MKDIKHTQLDLIYHFSLRYLIDISWWESVSSTRLSNESINLEHSLPLLFVHDRKKSNNFSHLNPIEYILHMCQNVHTCVIKIRRLFTYLCNHFSFYWIMKKFSRNFASSNKFTSVQSNCIRLFLMPIYACLYWSWPI